jgi:hypothetical protein
MRISNLLHSQTLAVLLVTLFTSATASAQQQQQPQVFTNKTKFRIPYRYDAQEMQRLRAQEIRLYTSIDNGRRWQLAQTVPPEAAKFEFRATADGEYWFAVRTLDGNNQLHPGGANFTPGLKVVVDTTEPVLKLQLQPADSGHVRLAWSAVDTWLEAGKLKLEYRQPGQDKWQTVRVVPRASGETTWSVPGGGIVAVRGSVEDRAGNIGTAQIQTNVTPASDVQEERPSKPDFSRPVAEQDTPPAPAVADSSSGTGTAMPFPEDAFEASPHPLHPKSESQPDTPQVADNPFVDSQQEQGGIRNPQSLPVADRPEKRPEALQGRYPKAAKQATDLKGPVRIVKDTKFELGYELENVGASGVASVELFITQDNGEHWWRYGEDEDRKSPFSVEVPVEGTYGFAIRVRSGAGLAVEPPKNGDGPDMNVIVDRTPPDAEVLSIKPQKGKNGAEVLIRWKISDKHPSGAPISLSYAVNQEGPWIPVTGWQADEGEFAWQIGARVPPEVYILLDVRDAAGNMTSIMSEQPISIDVAQPSARIVDVETDESDELQK